MAQRVRIKQGETFSIDGHYLEDDGVTPRSLTGVTLKSQIRFQSQLIAALDVTVLDEEQGLYRLTAPGGTLSWPVSTLYWDIKEESGGVSRITETNFIEVEKAITTL
jgi:hypothetical protein